MTREEADNILLKATVEKYPTTYNGADVIQVLLEVFNDKEELEAQIKAKNEGYVKLVKAYAYIGTELDEAINMLSIKDKEIEFLKSQINSKPMMPKDHKG